MDVDRLDVFNNQKLTVVIHQSKGSAMICHLRDGLHQLDGRAAFSPDVFLNYRTRVPVKASPAFVMP